MSDHTARDHVDAEIGHEQGLGATEVARRLGVKRQTVYAYVSRGMLSRRVAADGRTSLFDPAEVERLRLGRRPDADGELHTQIATSLTRVGDDGLRVRGTDLVMLVGGGATFTEIVDLLWDSPPGEMWDGMSVGEQPSIDLTPPPVAGHLRTSPFGAITSAELTPLDELRLIVAMTSSADPLRDDLSPKGIRATGRALIAAFAAGIDGWGRPTGSIAATLWARLTQHRPTAAKLDALDAAMALLADHGLASSTFATRVAASVRADPYSVVTTGLGAVGGLLHGAASSAVHDLLVDAERLASAVEAVALARRRNAGYFPGHGHAIYRVQDPRYGELMARLVDAWGDDPRLVNVYRVRDVIGERTDATPNIDLALGALTYLADMPSASGKAIFAIARTAGWLAHAMEEYGEKPLRFRTQARYEGL